MTYSTYGMTCKVIYASDGTYYNSIEVK